MDDKRKRTLEEIFFQIAGLPEEKRHEALMHFFALALAVMEPKQIQSMRAELLRRRDDHSYERESEVIELIDGHLALRDLLPEV